MNERTKDFIFYGMVATAFFLAVANTIKEARATQPHASVVRDHYKSIIKQIPRQVEICTEKKVGGDKTGDAVVGAIIGGIIGNNVTKNMPDGGTAGAIIGGILGHQNSDATGESKLVCRYRTRFDESQETVYSHSTITFNYEGKTYTVRFNK